MNVLLANVFLPTLTLLALAKLRLTSRLGRDQAEAVACRRWRTLTWGEALARVQRFTHRQQWWVREIGCPMPNLLWYEQLNHQMPMLAATFPVKFQVIGFIRGFHLASMDDGTLLRLIAYVMTCRPTVYADYIFCQLMIRNHLMVVDGRHRWYDRRHHQIYTLIGYLNDGGDIGHVARREAGGGTVWPMQHIVEANLNLTSFEMRTINMLSQRHPGARQYVVRDNQKWLKALR